MPEPNAIICALGAGYQLVAIGIRREKSGNIVADLSLRNGRTLVAEPGVLTHPWAAPSGEPKRAQLEGDDAPTADQIATAIREELLEQAQAILQQPTRKPSRTEAADGGCPYEATPGGMVWNRPTTHGARQRRSPTSPPPSLTMSSWTMVPASAGSWRSRGTWAGRPLPRLRVPVKRFASLDWVSEWDRMSSSVRASALKNGCASHPSISYPTSPAGTSTTSASVPIPGHDWVFLHAGGGIGATGPVPDITVSLSPRPAASTSRDSHRGGVARERPRLPCPARPGTGHRYRADRASTAPSSPRCGRVDLTVYRSLGKTGTYKSEVQASAQQHVGAGFDRLHLPANWTSTANAPEKLAFEFKDCPLVIDDFVPSGTAVDAARLHATAERVIRGAGNRSGRGRMNADGSQARTTCRAASSSPAGRTSQKATHCGRA